MHEYSVVNALMDEVEVHVALHRAVSVRRVRVRIGDLAGVDRDLLRAAWSLVRQGTVCSEAEIEFEAEGTRWECPGCARVFADGARLRCDRCGRPARLRTGDALVLERIEMEVDDV